MIDRRSAIAMAAAALPVYHARAQEPSTRSQPRTYVLVHGAYGGAWVWRDVAPALAAFGHHVLTPTLTGLGDRSHLLSRDHDRHPCRRPRQHAALRWCARHHPRRAFLWRHAGNRRSRQDAAGDPAHRLPRRTDSGEW